MTANRRGLTDAERELFEMMHDRLALVRDQVNFALRESTVDHALPALAEVERIYHGAVVLKALLVDPMGPTSA